MNPIGWTDLLRRSKRRRPSSTNQVRMHCTMIVTAASPARVLGKAKSLIGAAEEGWVVYMTVQDVSDIAIRWRVTDFGGNMVEGRGKGGRKVYEPYARAKFTPAESVIPPKPSRMKT